VSMSYTLSVDGTLFFAPLGVFTASADGVSTASYGFEGLIVTRLVPGEVLLGVRLPRPMHIGGERRLMPWYAWAFDVAVFWGDVCDGDGDAESRLWKWNWHLWMGVALLLGGYKRSSTSPLSSWPADNTASMREKSD